MYYQYLFFIKKSVKYTDQEREFLSRMLFNSVYKDNFNLNRAMIEILFNTKLKRSFDPDKSKSQLLIYYASPIKINRINTDLIQILDSKVDKHDYDLLTQSDKFLIIGNSRIGKLTTSQANYINRLIASSPLTASKISQTSKPKLCNHYKDFNSEKNH
jgi:hypothetical protein